MLTQAPPAGLGQYALSALHYLSLFIELIIICLVLAMFYNNLLSIPVLVVASFVAEDWSYENLRVNFPEEGRTFLLSMMVFSGAAAVGISYTTAWCVRTTSSTTYSMVGALNKL